MSQYLSGSSDEKSTSCIVTQEMGIPKSSWDWVEELIGTETSSPKPYSFNEFAGTFGEMPDDDEIFLEVKFLNCVSPNKIMVRALQDERKYQLLEEQLQIAYENFKQRRAFDVGFHCAAKVNNYWVRAVVIDINGNDCTVSSYDDGMEYEVSIESVFPLIPPFDAIQAFHYKISLLNIFPLFGAWLPHVSFRITELLVPAKNILVCFRGKSSTGFSTMDAMIVYEYNQPHGPLQIGGRILANLNEQLVKENLAATKMMITSVHDPTISAWLKPSPSKIIDGFLGHVTFVTMDGSVHIYDINKSVNMLNEMSHFFTQAYGKSQPSKEDLGCQRGDLCVAKFQDGNWYRGVIVALEERPGTVTVCFVDYGTVEYVDRYDVRKQVQFEDVPVQVIQAYIDNVQPPGTRRGEPFMWPTETLNKIHTIVVDQRCWIRVHSQCPLMISLQLPDGDDLSRLLVASGLAEYKRAPRNLVW